MCRRIFLVFTVIVFTEVLAVVGTIVRLIGERFIDIGEEGVLEV